MTLSVNDRRANLKEALIAFLNALGGGKFALFFIDPTEYPNVLPTTWTELTSRYWIKDMDMNVQMYQFTALGYVKALKVSGRADEPQFRDDLGKLCKVLKSYVKGRTTSSLVDLYELVRESGVSEAFVQNALDADLISQILGRISARWEGDSLIIKVPHNFGLTLL